MTIVLYNKQQSITTQGKYYIKILFFVSSVI